MTANENPTVTIAPDVEMPLIGIGTWQARGSEAYDAVRAALELGYRHIDTATMYGNEREVGRALRDSGVAREEVFITTKLPSGDAGRERETIAASLEALGVDRLDLWLIHWPPNGRAAPKTWERFVEARDEGLTRAIGVSNYDSGQIDELIEATGVDPGRQPDQVVSRALRPRRRARAARPRRHARGLQPVSEHERERPRAAGDRRAPPA